MGRLYGREEGSVSDFAEALDKVEQVMYEIWARCLTLDVNVVLDLGFWRRAKRDRIRHEVTSLGASYQLHEVVLDQAAARVRVLARSADPKSPIQIGPTTFDRLWCEVEPLESDEPHIVVEG